jgi:phosphoglycolate phosphatase
MEAFRMYRLVIFDFDGTLADSFPWFVTVLNGVADRYGFRKAAPEDIDMLRGLDARMIVDWFGVPLWKLPMIARHMRALKAQHLHEIALFPGVDRLLRELDRSGITIAIVSSDAEDNVRASLGPDNARLVRHYGCGASLFGKQSRFRAVLKQARLPGAEAIAVGDEPRDAEAARRAGIAFGAVSWGYARIESLQAHAPEQTYSSVEDIVAKLAQAHDPLPFRNRFPDRGKSS